MEIEAVRQVLDTSFNGLSIEEAQQRLERYGKNVLEEEKISRFHIFIRQYQDFLIYILMVAAVISLFAADMRDFIIIVALILINGIIGFWQELKAETSIRALKKLTESRVTVIREGKAAHMPASDLIPDDVVPLAEGDLVTADIRLFESAGLSVDEATMTGESVPVTNDHRQVLPPDAPRRGTVGLCHPPLPRGLPPRGDGQVDGVLHGPGCRECRMMGFDSEKRVPSESRTAG